MALLLLTLIVFGGTQTKAYISSYKAHYNYGYVLHPSGIVTVTVDSARLHFILPMPHHLDLPETVQPFRCDRIKNDSISSQQRSACKNLEQIVQVFQGLRTDIAAQLQQRIGLIYSLIQATPETTRLRRWNPIGEIISTLTGLSTQDDLQPIKEALKKITGNLVHATDMWRTGTGTFVQSLGVQNQRIDNLKTLIDMQKQTMRDLYLEIGGLYSFEDNVVTVLAKSVNKLKELIFRETDMNLLYLSLEKLIAGKLPEYLISHGALRQELDKLERQLWVTHQDLTILHKHPQFYYTHGHFWIARKGRRLIISLSVPLTLRQLQPLFVYKLIRIPMPTPGTHGHYSELAVDFYGIAFHEDSDYYLLIESFSQLPSNRHVDLRHSDLILRRTAEHSCSMALITANLSLIHRYCGYDVVTSGLPPSIYKLTENKVLLSNISRATVLCPALHSEANATVIQPKELQVILHLQCDCSVTAGEFYVSLVRGSCHRHDLNITDMLSPKYPINLAYLTNFFDVKELQRFESHTALHKQINITLPKLIIDSPEYAVKLAKDQKARYKMSQIIEATKGQEKTFQKLGDYLYDSLLQGSNPHYFNIFAVFDWVIVGIGVVATVALVWVFILNLRLRAVMGLMAAPAVRADEISLNYFRTASVPPETNFSLFDEWRKISQDLTHLIPLDITVFVIIILIVLVFLAYRAYAVLKRQRALQLYMVVGNAAEQCEIAVMQLAYPIQFYVFLVDKNSDWILDIVFSYCVPHVHLRKGILVILFNEGRIKVDVPSKTKITHCMAYKLRALMARDHYISLLITDFNSKKIRSLMTIKNVTATQSVPVVGPGAGDIEMQDLSISSPSRLYPDLQEAESKV